MGFCIDLPLASPLCNCEARNRAGKVTRIRVNHRREATKTYIKVAWMELEAQGTLLSFDLTKHLCYLSYALFFPLGPCAPPQHVSIMLLARLETLQFTKAK